MGPTDPATHLRLAADRPAERADWLRAAAAVLRKSGTLTTDDPDKRAFDVLGRLDFEGLPVPALGTAALPATLPANGVPGQAPFTRGAAAQRADGWDIRAHLADPDPRSAAESALADLAGGAHSLWLAVGPGGTSVADLDEVLADVYLDLAPVVLQPTGLVNDQEVADLFGSLLQRRGIAAHPHSNLGADPIGRFIRSRAEPGDQPLRLEEPVSAVGTRAAELGIRGFVVDGTVAHEGGAGDAAELGYSMAVGVAYLRQLSDFGIGLDRALELLEFRYAATGDQFATTAKFRAARLLWDRVAELSGAGGGRPGQTQHAATSRAMMTRYDPWTNLLRTTIAAFSAGIGGAQSITVLPFDDALGVPDPLGRRLARNISHLLISESHVAATVDPAGGASAIETLTWELAQAAWTEFQQIEAAGSVLGALHDGSLRQRWDHAAARRSTRVSTRKQPITGISEFPLPGEELLQRRIRPEQLDTRWSAPYEQLRSRPALEPVFLATLGPVAVHGARAAFIRNAFAAGGIDTISAGATSTARDVLVAYRSAGAPAVVCLAGADGGYSEFGPEVVPALRAAGADRILLAGRPSAALAELVDDHLAVGEQLVEFLHRTRRALGAARE